MYQIVKKETLVPNIIYLEIKAPKIARVARPGQFVILMVDETGERVPMGLANWDEEVGTIGIVFYVLGTSTMKLATLKVGESILNVAGPMGTPTEIENFGTIICACGCFGIGPTYPLVKALKEKGNRVITVMEGRGQGFLFWEDKLREYSDEFYVFLGDGSQGNKGWTNDFIAEYLESENPVDRIIVHGCPFMMMECSKASQPFGTKTLVSLTPLMVDGTGMCGACRVEVNGETKFACVDGPEFDGHEVNWENITFRLRQFIAEEELSHGIWERKNWHKLVDISPHNFGSMVSPKQKEKIII